MGAVKTIINTEWKGLYSLDIRGSEQNYVHRN